MKQKNSGASITRLTTTTSIELHNICVTDSQCMNGGICMNREIQQQQQEDLADDNNNIIRTSNNYTICQCTENYSGVRCEQLKTCPLNCQNGVICHHNTRTNKNINNNTKIIFEQKDEGNSSNNVNYSCKCFGYYAGPLCTIPYINCYNNVQCYNGGTCQSSSTTTTTFVTKNNNNNVPSCVCPNGYTGTDCSIVSTNSPKNENKNTFLSLFTTGSSSTTGTNINKEESILIVLIVIVLSSLLIVLLYTCRHCYRKRMIEYQLINSSSSTTTNNNEGTACTEPYNVRDSVWQTTTTTTKHKQSNQQQPVSTKSLSVLTDKVSTTDDSNDNFELSQQYTNLKSKIQQQQQQSPRWKNIV